MKMLHDPSLWASTERAHDCALSAAWQRRDLKGALPLTRPPEIAEAAQAENDHWQQGGFSSALPSASQLATVLQSGLHSTSTPVPPESRNSYSRARIRASLTLPVLEAHGIADAQALDAQGVVKEL